MTIAVISGKGGTGKSSISAAFATFSEEVVLADCDVDAANLYLLFNPSHEEDEVYISGQKAVIDYKICTNCGLCIDLMPSHSQEEELKSLKYHAMAVCFAHVYVR
jgi:MinD superfamily P-loop ATPase